VRRHPDALASGIHIDLFRSNVVITWNVLRAAAEVSRLVPDARVWQAGSCSQLGIARVAQASSVNVLRAGYSVQPQFDYFPIDELHPTLPDEPYGLSKL
jgi:nucleoside-diphosphate-sugar epimerase